MATVLLVSPHRATRDALADLLEHEGFVPLTLGTLAGVIALVREMARPPAVLVIDFDGSAAAEQLLRAQAAAPELAGVPVVVLAAASSAPAAPLGPDDVCLTKPLDLRALVRTIDRLASCGVSALSF